MEFENLEQVQMSNCRKGNEPLDWQKNGINSKGREAIELISGIELQMGLERSLYRAIMGDV
jgi:hypothetical protein